MKVGFYAGSFDPFTNGHLAVLKKALKLFDKVIIGIGTNRKKPQRRFEKELIKQTIEQILIREGIENVEILCYDNATTDVALDSETTFLVRGLRDGMDYQQEEQGAAANEKISGLDTIYVRAGDLGVISSSFVMELVYYGKDVSEYVPKEILELINNKSKE